MRTSIVFLIPVIAVMLNGCTSEPATQAVDIAVDEEAIRAVSAQWFGLARQKNALHKMNRLAKWPSRFEMQVE